MVLKAVRIRSHHAATSHVWRRFCYAPVYWDLSLIRFVLRWAVRHSPQQVNHLSIPRFSGAYASTNKLYLRRLLSTETATK